MFHPIRLPPQELRLIAAVLGATDGTYIILEKLGRVNAQHTGSDKIMVYLADKYLFDAHTRGTKTSYRANCSTD